MHIDRVAISATTDVLVASMSDDGPLPAYRAMQRGGRLHHDPAQEPAEKLQSLYNALHDYRPEADNIGALRSWAARLGLARRRDEEAPQGLYPMAGSVAANRC